MPGPPPVPKIAQARISAHQRPDFGLGPVVAAIVDDNHLAKGGFRHIGEGFLDQAADIAFLVKRRNHNGNTHDSSLGGAANGRYGSTSKQLSPRRTTLYTVPLPTHL